MRFQKAHIIFWSFVFLVIGTGKDTEAANRTTNDKKKVVADKTKGQEDKQKQKKKKKMGHEHPSSIHSISISHENALSCNYMCNCNFKCFSPPYLVDLPMLEPAIHPSFDCV